MFNIEQITEVELESCSGQLSGGLEALGGTMTAYGIAILAFSAVLTGGTSLVAVAAIGLGASLVGDAGVAATIYEFAK